MAEEAGREPIENGIDPEKVKALLDLLGVTEAEVSAYLEKEKKPILVKPKAPKLPEYVLERTLVCKTCGAETKKIYKMLQSEHSPMLESWLVPENPGDLPTKIDFLVVTTCTECLQALMQLEKEKIAKMYLNLLNGDIGHGTEQDGEGEGEGDGNTL